MPPPRPAPDTRRPVYTVRVDARPAESVVEGDLTVRFTPDLPTDVLVFRLWANGPRTQSAGVGIDVGAVTRAGQVLAASMPDPTTLEVALGTALAPGQSVEVSLPWRLVVPASVDDRISHSGDTLRLGSFLPILSWEPGVGWALEPPTGAFAEAASSPVADYDVAVTVPPGYDVLATGVPGGDGHWRSSAVRDFSMSVGHFAVVSSVEGLPDPVTVTVGVDASVAEDPGAYHARVVAALADFAGTYGAYPWPTFNLAITPDLGGGIEFPSNVLQGPGTIGRTTPHEVAHMWFYGLVGNNQGRDPWLDEGLASWAEFRFEGTIGANQNKSIPGDAAGLAGEPMTYWEGHKSSYYRGVYVQGAVALASLGTPEQVDCALRHYVAANAFGIARPDDLYAALEVVFPDARARLAPYGLG